MDCTEKQTMHETKDLDYASINMNDVVKSVAKKINTIDKTINETQKKILFDTQEMTSTTEDTNIILDAVRTAGFTNPVNNKNLNSITNMIEHAIDKIMGKKKIIEGHTNACHGTSPDGTSPGDDLCGQHWYDANGEPTVGHKPGDHDDIMAKKVLERIRTYFISGPTYDAQKEFTSLDVNSKKQWMYLWGILLTSILAFKLYIVSKK